MIAVCENDRSSSLLLNNLFIKKFFAEFSEIFLTLLKFQPSLSHSAQEIL